MKRVLNRINSSSKKILSIINKHKKKLIIGLCAFIMLFISSFLYINLTNPTKINRYIAHVINKGNPANNAFEDENFYNAIVDAYNTQNKTSLPYTTNLTDEQLKKITSLTAYRKKIFSIKGVEKIEKLTLLSLVDNKLIDVDISNNLNLTSLDLSKNAIDYINLSKNVKLERVNLASNYLEELDISSLNKLKIINLTRNSIAGINFDNNLNLEEIRLYDNNISKIDVSKLSKLVVLDLSRNNLSEINLQNKPLLVMLNISHNKISSINLSFLPKIEYLSAGINLMDEIDVSQNINLEKLYLYNDMEFCTLMSCSKSSNYSNGGGGSSWATKGKVLIKRLDLTNNINLLELNACNNDLHEIDLTHNQLLRELNLGSNKLTSIDLSHNINLKYLDLGKGEANYGYGLGKGNQLTTIDLTNNSKISTLNLDSNYLTYIDLSKATSSYVNFDASYNNLEKIVLNNKITMSESKLKETIGKQMHSQELIDFGMKRQIKPDSTMKYFINDKILVNEVQNISSFIKKLNLENLTAKIFDSNNEVTSGNIKSGYKLNVYYENTIIQSVPIYVFMSEYFDDFDFYKAVVDSYNKENNTSLSYDVNLTEEQLSMISTVEYRGETLLNTVGLNKLKNLVKLTLEYNGLKNIDLTENVKLQYLSLSGNDISNVNLSNNTDLKWLDLSSNKLTNIDLSKNTALISLYLSSNNINNIDLNQNTRLDYLNLSNNNINNIDLNQNTRLKSLNLSNNNINNIDLSKNTALTSLYLSNNNISDI